MNQLYYGDNLDILRNHIPDESVDLIYLDPPFNRKVTPLTCCRHCVLR
jgi:site-specific DNA-methyltransferase (adenine-specific)